MYNRMRELEGETRCGYKVCFGVKYDGGRSEYVVTKFVTEHNHDLTLETSIKSLRSHWKVDRVDYA